MAPKAKAPAAVLPTEEELLELPEGVSVPDPSFVFVLAQVVSHSFAVEAEDDALREFDPGESLAKLRDSEAHLLLAREDLESFAEGGSLASGLRRKAEAEAACRRRRKVNAARRAALEGTASASAASAAGAGLESVDLMVVVCGYPSTAAELEDLASEGVFELADAWVSLHLSGESLADETDEAGVTRRKASLLGAPEVLCALRERVVGADEASRFASAIVTELYDCHTWASSDPGEEAPNPAILAAILAAITSAAQRRMAYKEWLQLFPKRRVAIPNSPDASQVGTTLYERLAGSVDPSHHDVPFMLYCLCEQVNHSLKGDGPEAPQRNNLSEQMQENAQKELSLMEDFLHAAGDILLMGPDAPQPEETEPAEAEGSLLAMMEQEEKAAEGQLEEQAHVPGMAPPPGLGSIPTEDAEEQILLHHDAVSCRHVGDTLPGGKSVAKELEKLLSHLNGPGVNRLNFPRVSMSAAERSAHRNRIYKHMPSMPVVELERLLLLEEFRKLLQEAQPERRWDLKDRMFHEKIPSALLCQALMGAMERREYFVNMKYMERQDCLLLALHHRALPGRVMWHSWEGDLLSLRHEGKTSKLCPMPSFNDWWQLVSGQPSPAPPDQQPAKGQAKKREPGAWVGADSALPPCPEQALDLDAREVGYCRAIEKILIPSDRSVILRTAFQRGVREAVPDLSKDGEVPTKAVADEDDEESAEEEETELEPFVPLCRRELRSVRVIKDNLTFGMVSDAAWADTVEALREMRQSKEEPIQDPQDEDEDAKERDALRAAQGITADGDDAEEEATEPVAEEATEEDPAVNITERYMDESKFGCLWIVFKDGTRCTVRMHHERLWYSPGDVSWDVSSSRPGVQVSYTPPSGVVVQAFSDASIRQSWLRPVPSGAAEDLLPGQAQDLEQARLVTAFGVLVIERLSGRREVYHPSGTRAWRNPTTEELQQRVEQFRRAAGHCDAVAQAFAKRLAQICEAWEANQAEEEEMDPSETNKYFGMPGHWRVTTREGRRFGRAERAWPELEVPEVPEVPEADVLGDESKRSSKAESRGSKPPSRPPSKNPSKDEAPPPAEDEDLESEPEPPEPPPSLQDILEAVLVDEGNNIEYELDPVPMLTMLDPHTGITSISNEEGMLVLLDKESSVCVLPDGTRLTCLAETEGSQVVMEKEGAARVTCRIKDKAYVPNSMVQVEMEDGATMEVVPRRLNLKAELVPSDPQRFLAKLHGEPEDAQAAALEISQQRNSMSQHEFCINHDPREDSYSTNASVILRQPDGTMLHSKGAGEVELVSGMDLAAVGGEKALKTLQDKGCVYVAQVDYDRIFLRDDDGNYFEVQGDQSLDFKLSVSMGDDFASPRCVCPQKPFKHPDASFLPLPEEAPPPRLFVVYGDGEAEELLLPRDVEEALRLAKQDPKALVVEGERMGWPMSCCKTHSIHRIMPMDPVSVPLRPLELPPSMAGFVQPEMPQRTYTQFRQFIEYPRITEPKLKAWERAYEEYERHEEQRLLLRSSLGAGLRKASMRTSSTVSLSLADQTKLREDKTDTATEASDPREGGA